MNGGIFNISVFLNVKLRPAKEAFSNSLISNSLAANIERRKCTNLCSSKETEYFTLRTCFRVRDFLIENCTLLALYCDKRRTEHCFLFHASFSSIAEKRLLKVKGIFMDVCRSRIKKAWIIFLLTQLHFLWLSF